MAPDLPPGRPATTRRLQQFVGVPRSRLHMRLARSQRLAAMTKSMAGLSPGMPTIDGGYWEVLFETSIPGTTALTMRPRNTTTLGLLPPAPIGSALELACAEGHFTRLLAPRVGELLATDISDRALARAADQCEGVSNIAFQRLDLEADPLPRASTSSSARRSCTTLRTRRCCARSPRRSATRWRWVVTC